MSAVRRLAVAEAEAYRAIRLEMLQRYPLAFGSSEEEEAAWPLARFESTLADNAVFAAEESGAIAGVVALASYGMRKYRHKGYLWGMYVRAEARGRGLGRDLVEAVLAEARRREMEQVVLNVAAGNDAAERLYRRHGFRVCGTEPRSLAHQGRYVDEMQMVHFLEAPASRT